MAVCSDDGPAMAASDGGPAACRGRRPVSGAPAPPAVLQYDPLRRRRPHTVAASSGSLHKFMGVGDFPGFQFLATFIRGSEHRHFRSPKCPAPGTSGPLFFSKVQNATFQNGSGGLVVPRYFCQTGIGLWPCTSGALYFPEVQNATFQNGSGGLVVPPANQMVP